MANPLKKLAGETAIYGLSTILARIINFFFVPIYTRVLFLFRLGLLLRVCLLRIILSFLPALAGEKEKAAQRCHDK